MPRNAAEKKPLVGSSRQTSSDVAIVVDVDDRQSDATVDHPHLASLLASTLAAQPGARAGEVGLAFIDAVEMTALNRDHMGGDGPTDVLAFPIDGVSDAVLPKGQPALLGDIVICPAVAARAPQPLNDELALLVVHGALHLVGHDHAEPEETALMKALERDMLDRFHLS